MKSSPLQTKVARATPSPTPAQVAPELPAQVSPLQSMLRELRVRGSRPSPIQMMGANLDSALEALWANRTRSFLTALGIFIGVGAVVAALTLTQGVNQYITDQLSSLGNSVIIYPGASKQGGISQGVGSLSTITTVDAQNIATQPHVTSVSPFIITTDQAIYGSQNWITQVEGVNEEVQVIQNWTVAQGSWFSASDAQDGAKVAVLGDTVYHNLFDATGNNPIGQTIRIRDQLFRVVGVTAPQGSGLDDVIFIPLKVSQVRLKNTTTIDQIQVQADTANDVEPVAKEVTTILRKNHRIQGDNDDFNVFTFTQILQQVNTSEAVLTALLVGIAAISLTVGGIGIMNIMLVSVTERTWEIGIRMSIGARRSDILYQFLIEAVLLCLVGGIVGLGLGLLIGWGVVNASKLPFVITTVTLVVPFAVASSIALLFGLYPAIRASRLDPIVAIRSEE
ncbi:MAG: ABC transporter permease [Ktedonobacteraceae bacterium]